MAGDNIKKENPFFLNNFNSLCATCNTLLPCSRMPKLFDNIPNSTTNVRFFDILQKFSDFNIEDGPQYLCNNCYDKLILIHDFREVCNQSHAYIKDYQSLEVEEIVIKPKPKKVEANGKKQQRTKKPYYKGGSRRKKKKTCDICGKRYLLLFFNYHYAKHSVIPKKEVEVNSDEDFIWPESQSFSENVEEDSKSNVVDEKVPVDQPPEHFTNDSDIQTDSKTHAKNIGSALLCPYCGYVAGSRNMLKTHAASHARDAFMKHDFDLMESMIAMFKIDTFVCDQCGKCFFLRENYRQHYMNHTGERPHQCKECGKGFKTKSALKDHFLTHTPDPVLFPCQICSKAFNRRDNLKTHEIVHTREKKFNCHICGTLFGYAHTLRSHINKMHPDSESKLSIKADVDS